MRDVVPHSWLSHGGRCRYMCCPVEALGPGAEGVMSDKAYQLGVVNMRCSQMVRVRVKGAVTSPSQANQ